VYYIWLQNHITFKSCNMRLSSAKLLCAFIFLSVFTACSKDDDTTPTPSTIPPFIISIGVTNITSNSAQSGGSVTHEGDSPVTARGVCWSTSLPTIANAKTVNGAGPGIFSSTMTGLNPSTTYRMRAYATNAAGTSYGSEETFTTP